MTEQQDHYFSTQPGDAATERTLEVDLDGTPIPVITAGGVFSGSRLDPGTAVLLRHLTREGIAPPPGDVLDLGCGWGPIALAMARATPQARVWAVDVNERALELTRRNAAATGVAVQAVAPDHVPTDLRFAAIWSNPPIRIGKPALHELLTSWLPRLAPGGDAWLVVQRNLGADSLQQWISEHVTVLGAAVDVSRETSSKGFRVLRVRQA